MVLASIAALVLVAAAAAQAGTVRSGDWRVHARTVTSWPFVDPYGSFAESMALGRDGNLYASLTTWGDASDVGQVVRISLRTGARTAFGGTIESPGLLTGLAFDRAGHLYVAAATFSDDPAPGVFRVDRNGPPTRVLTLPAESFPNGLAFRDGLLYVSDSALGAIWRARPEPGAPALETPWLQDALLAPGTGPDDKQIGANGIAFAHGSLYVAVSDAGRIVRIPLRQDGSPGKLKTVAEQPELVTADGITFDPLGDLWIAANGPDSGRLLVLLPTGKLVTLPTEPSWLDYPTTIVLAPQAAPLGTLYVENGSFDGGTPSVLALAVGR